MKLPSLFTATKFPSLGPLTSAQAPVGTFAKPQELSASGLKAELAGFNKDSADIKKSIQRARNFFTDLGVSANEGNGPVSIQMDPTKPDAMYSVIDTTLPNGTISRSNEHIMIGRDPFTGKSFGHSPDVILHEYAHRINEHLVPGLGATPLSRIVDESIADTMAAAMDGNWTIGEKIVPGGIRSMEHPESQQILDGSVRKTMPTITKLSQITEQSVKELGPYANMGPLNNAAFRIGTQIGTKPMAQIYLQTLRKHLHPQSAMTDLIVGTIKSAGELFGDHSSQQKIVRDAWISVGAPQGAVTAVK